MDMLCLVPQTNLDPFLFFVPSVQSTKRLTRLDILAGSKQDPEKLEMQI